MPDQFSPSKRSEIMASIKSKNSKAEVEVFRYLRARKIYFQKHYSRAPGSPDIALPRKKIAVFIDGDFWHGRTLEKLKARKVNEIGEYWIKKIERNIARDARQERELARLGWSIARVWESDIMRKRTRQAALSKIERFLLAT